MKNISRPKIMMKQCYNNTSLEKRKFLCDHKHKLDKLCNI